MSEFNEKMAHIAEDAVDYARKLKKELDYSEASIKDIEAICTLLYNDIPRGLFKKLLRKPPPEDMFVQMSTMLGAYVGEVMRRHYGGDWSIEDVLGSGKTIVITIGELKTFPPAKIYKRLKNGPEDSIDSYYHVMTKDQERKF